MRYAVILAGGGGTRLWPLSRVSCPKQFLPLAGNESLLAATARRLRSTCDEVHVVTIESQAELVANALPGLPKDRIIGEPAARNTGPAIGLAAALLVATDPNAVLGIVPSDHFVSEEAEFARICDQAFSVAETEPGIVTIGVVPTSPDTGFGYLEIAPGASPPAPVRAFKEKPDRETAEGYLQAGHYLWNAGMFFARADHILGEIRKHLPETGAILDAITKAMAEGGRGEALSLAQSEYPKTESISFDFGVMEKTESVSTLPADFGWSDVGSWAALSEIRDSDERGNTIKGEVVLVDADNVIAVADPGSVVAVAGVKDIVVVKSGDAVLVTHRDGSQEVRTVVAELKKRKLEKFL